MSAFAIGRTQRRVTELEREVADLRDLARARLGVIDDLAEKAVQLEAEVARLTQLFIDVADRLDAVTPPAAVAEQAEADGTAPPATGPADGASGTPPTPRDGAEGVASDQEPERPARNARPSGAVSGRGARDRVTGKQQQLLEAVAELGEASTSEVAAQAGRVGEEVAVGNALKQLRDRGLVAHNGRRARGARWLAVDASASSEAAGNGEAGGRSPGRPAKPAVSEDTAQDERYPAASLEENERARAEAQTIVLPAPDEAGPPPVAERPAPAALTDEDERIIALVAEHGPVTHIWVADQLVANRRETGMRMRDLARDGHLIDLDGAFATPDIAQEAA